MNVQRIDWGNTFWLAVALAMIYLGTRSWAAALGTLILVGLFSSGKVDKIPR